MKVTFVVNNSLAGTIHILQYFFNVLIGNEVTYRTVQNTPKDHKVCKEEVNENLYWWLLPKATLTKALRSMEYCFRLEFVSGIHRWGEELRPPVVFLFLLEMRNMFYLFFTCSDSLNFVTPVTLIGVQSFSLLCLYWIKESGHTHTSVNGTYLWSSHADPPFTSLLTGSVFPGPSQMFQT